MTETHDLTPFKFKVSTKVRMSHTDIAGIANNIAFFKYIEIARFDYFSNIGMSYHDLVQFGAASALVESSCRYLSPLYFDDVIDVHTRVNRLGRSSFEMDYLIVVPERDVVSARGKTVTVFFDPDTKKSIPMPEGFKQAIIDFEGEENIEVK
jgi:acyl-CoA thioester hydrolase